MTIENGKNKKLETDCSGEKTYVFECTYDEKGNCISEELVAWIWGEFDSEEQIRAWAENRRLKAEYRI